eukprot:3358914-Alexandrium_andersonii.AAC.1
MSASLVGSEMCIRDRDFSRGFWASRGISAARPSASSVSEASQRLRQPLSCLLYTSDAADDM